MGSILLFSTILRFKAVCVTASLCLEAFPCAVRNELLLIRSRNELIPLTADAQNCPPAYPMLRR
jgi:hypothetical protein